MIRRLIIAGVLIAGVLIAGVLIAGVIVLAVLGGRALWARWAPAPQIVISRETTYITEPLGEDGLPDYLEYLRRRHGKDVTPENNAAALIWRAVGPRSLPEQVRREWFGQLGVESPPVEGEYFVPLDNAAFVEAGARWLAEIWRSRGRSKDASARDTRADQSRQTEDVSRLLSKLPADLQGRLRSVLSQDKRFQSEAKEAFERVVRLACRRPWSEERFPTRCEWVRRNERALDLACQASERPRYCSAFVSTGQPPVLTMLRETEQQTRGLVRGLAVRAMSRVGAKRFREAQADALAIHRLARLVGRAPNSLGHYLGAIWGDSAACQAHWALAAEPEAPDDVLQTSLRELQRLKRWKGAASAVDEGERVLTLDAVLWMRRHAGDAEGLGRFGKSLSRHVLGRAHDWNTILRDVNSMYDEVARAMRLPDRAARSAAQEAIVEQITPKKRGVSWWLRAALSPRRATSQTIAQIVKALLLPDAELLVQVEQRANMELDLTMAAVALAVYRAQHGTYPQALDELAPDILDTAPQDLWGDGRLRYERRGEGYLLYSVSPDGDDDGGSNDDRSIVDGEWRDDVADSCSDDCDLVIRAPIPPLEVP